MKDEQINVKVEPMKFKTGLQGEDTFPLHVKPEAQDHLASLSEEEHMKSLASVLEDLEGL